MKMLSKGANQILLNSLRKEAFQSVGLNGIRQGSNGSDITLSSFDSSSGLNTPRELVTDANISKNQTLYSPCYQEQQKTWRDMAINDSSTEFSMNSPRYFFPSLRSPMALKDSVDQFRADLIALSRRAEVSELELQTLRKQIVKESKKSQDLLKEISSLKEERNALKDECENLKASRNCSDDLKVKSNYQFEGDPWNLIEVSREELNYEKEMNASLRIQLQKTQDANEELTCAVQNLEMLEKNSKVVSHLSHRTISEESKSQSDDDEAQKALEDLVRQHSDAQETYMLEQKIMDLCSEIEMYRRDKDELEIQMEQLALDYEILKQEKHEFSTRLEQNHLQEQLKMLYDGSSTYAVIRELEDQRLKLIFELNVKVEELSHCLAEIKDLEAYNITLKEELRKQEQRLEADMKAVKSAHMKQQQRAEQAEASLDESDAIISELEAEIEKLNDEHKDTLEELSRSFAAINNLESRNCYLEEELKIQAQRFKADMESLRLAKKEQEERALKAEEDAIHSGVTLNLLQTQIKKLETELKKHSEESTNNLTIVKELESHIQNLEDELEKKAEGFEADLETVSRSKVEQEQRAIQAEEALRLVRWRNANTAARIQDEFKRLSSQIHSSFVVKEKLSSKALTEACDLMMHNRHLQDLLQKTNEQLQSAKDEYNTKLEALYLQIRLKCSLIEQMESEIQEKTIQMEIQKKQTDELQRGISAQHSDHQSEIEKLASENKSLAEQLLALTKERDLLFQKGNTEVAGKSLEVLTMLKNIKNEKEHEVMSLKLELEDRRAQCDSLKHSLHEDELEKETLRKQVFQLKADLNKKDEAISAIEKKFKEYNARAIDQHKSKPTSKNSKLERSPKEVGSKEVATLKERIKLLEGHIKSKEVSLEISANAFLAKEKGLNGKIMELESKLRILGHDNRYIGHDAIPQEKVSIGTQAGCHNEDTLSVTDQSSNNMQPNRNDQTGADSQPMPSYNDSENQQMIDVLLKEMVLLKQMNNSMETELNEMQERYSEKSVKFAEVEGERQQLMLKVCSP
ncbi:uncharacterized protein LOC130800099 isoform X2 [Amaranthus tricolor]|uniref:uncharacterized protein LOC130800099 isoform X2 n=1 Tax=Amaranthus tricolor TaxID=29722 RepID=UPI0025901F33|nr:uncharacterized protein LOC130800099 isoform X2 [Amaranthus tricolor]